MADRFWVGGTGTWNTTNTANWSATSGGAGGASVPTSADTVTFDSASNATAYTVTIGASVSCFFFSLTRPASGSVTWAGTSPLNISGRAFIASTGVTRTYTGVITFSSTSGPWYNSFGVTLGSNIVFDGVGGDWILNTALTTTGSVTVTNGTFTTNNYNVTASSLSSSNSNTRTINLGSSTVTLTGGSVLFFTTATNLTFNAGTSNIVLTAGSLSILGGGVSFNNLNCTSTANASISISGANTFNNLSFTGRTSAGIAQVSLAANQTINGTLTLSAGTNATMRTFVRSDTIGTTRTLTCAAVASLTDIDFRDIAIAGAAAPVSGTRLGDCKGNSGITFDAAKTVYYNSSTSGNWSGAVWWHTANGVNNNYIYFPLAQDTVIVPAPYLASGATITISAAYNIGTIDMSARTSNTMTLATGSTTPTIYGNWINGTGTTIGGTGTFTFAGRGSQTITSAGKTFTQGFTINTPGGSVTLQDAFTCSSATTTFIAGTFDANNFNVTLSSASSTVATSITTTRTIAVGSGTWTIAGTTSWSASTSTNLTVTGTGTISLTSASAKSFQGGGIQTYPTINQGGTGTLTVTGSNKFADITNTAIGRVQFTGGTTNEFGAFNLNGVLGNLLQVGSTNTTQAILKAPSWNVGLLSTDAGNNTGLSFTGTDPNYLSISYINGQLSLTSSVYYGATNITAIYYGSTPVSAIYYGADQVF